MNILDIITLILFSVGIIVVGLSFAKKGQNMKSFFAGGGAMPWQMSGLSLFMGFFSAGTFVVWGSIAYMEGWVAITIQWTMAIAGFVVGAFIAPRWHKTGALTAAEYINERLGLKTQKIYTYLFLVISLFLTASFLYPVAKIVEVSTGLSLNTCILLLGALCILYVSLGGLWAVVSTDILQFVILTTAVIIVIPLSFDQVEGVSNFVSAAPEAFFSALSGEYTIGFIISFAVYNTIFLGGNWAYVQRYTCVKTDQDAKKVGWLFGTLYIVSPVLWMLPPMVYKLTNSTLSSLEAEGAYLMICKEVLPTGLMGLMIGGMIFATTSALNSKLNIAAGVFTNDIFKRFRPNSSDKVLMRTATLSTIGFGVITIGIALLIPMMGGVVNVVISLAALTGVPLYLPTIWCLFSKRQTAVSTMTTTVLGLAVNCFFKFIMPWFDVSLDRAEEMILGVSFPIVCLLVFELYYIFTNRVSDKYESYQRWEESNHLREENLSVLEVQQVEEDNKFSLKVVGIGILCTGIAVSILGGLADDGKVLIITTGTVFALLGWFVMKRGIKK